MNRNGGSFTLINETVSLCPVCLARVPAQIVDIDSEIYMHKICPEHGEYQTVIWRDSKENYLRWLDYGSSHQQEICSAAIMTTNRCNLNCPVCFTRTPEEPLYEPDLESIRKMFKFYLNSFGEPYPVELCGGEPTVRDDLPDVISLGRDMGFDYIQLNTNGLRIARDRHYLEKLKRAGLTTVYLSFDGITEEPYDYSSGAGLFQIKLQAIKNCREAGLAVVLVPCIIPDINDHQLGGIIQLAKELMPTVKGVHFQPISYFGNYPVQPLNKDRITIPEILRSLEKQTHGEIQMDSFLPAGCEHPQCSFSGFFLLNKAGKLQALTKFQKREYKEDAAAKIRLFTKNNWRYSERMTLTIGGMAFQDVWNIDLERLKRCIIHIIGQDHKFVPLCAKYLTGIDGERFNPGIS